MAYNTIIPVIYYHSIAPQKNSSWFRSEHTLELNFFEEHLKYFINNRYLSLFLSEQTDLRSADLPIKENYFCLTFDDGYVDNFIYLFPLLKKYNIKATIFIIPDFIDKREIVRKNLEDYWGGKASFDEINKWGFLSWDELRIMEKSGLVDIQSHTLTHTKYFISDELTGFHHPGADCLYPVVNIFTDIAPYYIGNLDFEKLIPYGYPFFEEASSIIAKRVFINDEFISGVLNLLKNHGWRNKYNFNKIFNRIESFYLEYKKNNNIISSIETEEKYRERVNKELKLSKEIIEKELSKKVEYLCWPHGDNNSFTHRAALEAGYRATSAGKMKVDKNDLTRFERFGLDSVHNSTLFTKIKTNYKIKSYMNMEPYLSIKKIYEYFRDRF